MLSWKLHCNIETVKEKLQSIGRISFVAFGVIANAASILGFWLGYASSSADTQAKFGKLLSLVGAIVAAAAYLFLAWLVLHRKKPEQNVEKAFSADNILIFSNGPVLYVSRQRSHVDIQMTVFSTAAIELLYVEAKVICNSVELMILESSKPVAIPESNPQSQVIGKNLTEKELQGFDTDPGQFFQIAGYAKFRGPKNKDATVLFSFNAAAWRLPDKAI
jgi:hypothetical protein